MKPLPEPWPFRDIVAPEYHRRGEECFRIIERHRFLQYMHPAELREDMLLSCPLYCRTRSWSGDYHYRKSPVFLTVTLIHSGETAFRTGDLDGIATPGDILLFHPKTEYEFMTEHASERSALLMTGPLLQPLLASSGLAEKSVVTLADTAEVGRIMMEIGVALRDSSRSIGRKKISELCFALIQALAAPVPTDTAPELLKRIIFDMEKYYDRQLSVNGLAQKNGTTPSAITRMFRKYRNTTPYRYLRDLRINQAAKLLEERAFTIKEIAAKVGYEQPLNFSTEFKKCVGISPREFRNGGRAKIQENE